jgi:phosphatidate cytidylyltransferase
LPGIPDGNAVLEEFKIMGKRILSATVGIILLVTVLLVSDRNKYFFNGAVSILAAISVGEIFIATKFVSHKPLLIASVAFAAAIPFMTVATVRPYLGVLMLAYAIFTLAVMLKKREEIALRDISLLFMLTLLIPFAFSMLVRLRDMGLLGTYGMAKRDGMFLLLVACGCSWLADTGAYFSGRFLGKHKLAPSISPNKTIEGFAGGILFNMLGMVGISFLYAARFSAGATVNIPFILLLAFGGGILGTLGDLSASYIKRSCHVKDFGNIMPGHGGVMDRFDSILLVAPFVYVTVALLGDIWPLIIR